MSNVPPIALRSFLILKPSTVFSLAITLVGLLTPGAIDAQPSVFTALGRIEGQSSTMSLGSAASGTVKDILVREWSRVRAGELLVTLDCRPLEAGLQVRGGQLGAAESALERVRNGPRPDEIAVGEAAAAPLLQMIPEDTLRVGAEIDPRDLARVCENQPATVNLRLPIGVPVMVRFGPCPSRS